MSSARKLVPLEEHHRDPASALHPDSPWVRAVRLLVGAFVLAALV